MLRGVVTIAFFVSLIGVFGLIAAEPPLPTGAIPLGGHKDVAFAAAVDPGGLTGVTASFDKTLRVWDMAQGRLIRELGGPTGAQGIILGTDISADGQWLAAVGMDQTLRIWENPRLEPGSALALPGPNPEVTCAVQGDDPTTRILCSAKGELYRIKLAPPGSPPVPEKLEPFGEKSTITDPKGRVIQILRLANNHYALGTDKGEILLTDPKGKRLKIWLAQQSPITQMEVGWDGLVSVELGGRLKSWRPDAVPSKLWPDSKAKAPARLIGTEPDKVLVLPGLGKPGLAQWCFLPDGRPMHELLLSEKVTTAVAGAGPEGPLAILAQSDRDWAVWGGNQKEEKLRIQAPGKILSMAILAGGRIVLSIEGLGVQRWQPPVGEPGKPFPIDQAIDKAEIVSIGRRLLIAGADGKLRSMEGAIPRVDRETSKPPGYHVGTLSPDGLDFVAGLQDGTITWNRRPTGDAWQPGMKVDSGPVAGITWLSTSVLLTWNQAGTIKAWKNPWDNGFKPGEKPEKFLLPEIPESKGGPVRKVIEVESGILVWRDGVNPKWVNLTEKKARDLTPFPEGPIAQLTVFGRKVVAFGRNGKGYLLEDFKGDGPWIPFAGCATDSVPFALSMSHPERAVLVSQKGNEFFADLYDLKDLSLVGRYGPWADLKAAVVIPFANKVLTLRTKSAQFHWAHYEGRLPETSPYAMVVGGANMLLGKTPDGRIVHTDHNAVPPKVTTLGSAGAGPIAISRNGYLGAWVSDQRLVLKDLRTDQPAKTIDLKTTIRSLRFDVEERRLLAITANDEALVLDALGGFFLEGSIPGRKIHDAICGNSQQGLILSDDQGIEPVPYALTRQIPLPEGAKAVAGYGTQGAWAVTQQGAVVPLLAADGKPDKPLISNPDFIGVEQSRIQQLIAVASSLDVRFFGLDGKELAALVSPETIKRIALHPARPWLLIELDKSALVYDLTRLPAPPKGEEPIRLLGQVRLPEKHGLLAWQGQQDQSLLIPTEKGLLSWRIAQDTPIRSIPHPQAIDSVAFDPKGRFVATGCRDFKVRLWDLATGAMKKEIALSSKPVPGPMQIYALAFRPDGAALAVAGMDRAVRVYDSVSGNLIREFPGQPDRPKAGAPPIQGHDDAIFSLAWSPSGELLASAGVDRTIRLWNISQNRQEKLLIDSTLKPVRPGSGPVSHPGWIHSLRFMGPDQLLSSGAGPKGIGVFRTWKIPDGALQSRFAIPQGPVHQVAFSPLTGKALIASGYRVKTAEAEETISFLAPWPFPSTWIQVPTPDSRKKE